MFWSERTRKLMAEVGIEYIDGEYIIHPLPTWKEAMRQDMQNLGRDMYNAIDKLYGKTGTTEQGN